MAPAQEERTVMQKLNNLPEDEKAKLPKPARKRLQAYNRARRDEREEVLALYHLIPKKDFPSFPQEDKAKLKQELREEVRKELEKDIRIDILLEDSPIDDNFHLIPKECPKEKDAVQLEVNKLRTLLKTYQQELYFRHIPMSLNHSSSNPSKPANPPPTPKVNPSPVKEKERKFNKLSMRPVLHKRDLNTLREDHWVNDNIITAILYHLSKYSTSVTTLSTFLYTNIATNRNTNTLLRRTNIFHFKEVLFPCHLGTHWILVRYRPRRHTLEILDSLGENKTSHLVGEKVVSWISQEALRKKHHLAEAITILTRHNYPLQTDATSCGVYLSHYAQSIIDREPCIVGDINRIRSYWKDKLRKYTKKNRRK